MAQHDMNIANQGFPATRADLNNALQALASNNSGTSAPSTTFANQWWYDTTNNKLYIRNEANNAWIEVAILDQTNNEWQITTGVIQAKDGDGLALKTDDGTTRLFIRDSDGSIGIGTTSPSTTAHISSSASSQLILTNTDGGASTPARLVLQKDGGSAADDDIVGQVDFNGEDDAGNDTVYARVRGVSEDVTDGTEDGSLSFWTRQENVLSQKATIRPDGDIGIGTNTPRTLLELQKSTGAQLTLSTSDTSQAENQLIGGINFHNPDASGTGPNNAALIEAQSAGSLGNAANLLIKTTTAASEGDDATETARFNSAGDFLVSTTDNTLYNNTSGSGLCYRSNDELTISSESTTPLLILNYTGGSTTGTADLIRFATDGATVGTFGAHSGGFFIGDSDVGLEFDGQNDDIRPFNVSTHVIRDNALDLGDATARFDDVFATNSAIQTSDEREKQNIASLTSAEITAATAISKLFKTFKWKDKVSAKGDAARTHAGVIAQQVEQAMTDAGLTASNYAFWCSDTWWETQTEVAAVEADGPREAREAHTRTDIYNTEAEAPEGATERNRKGIRYPELLAFIGAATEQRLTSIEARLTALEG